MGSLTNEFRTISLLVLAFGSSSCGGRALPSGAPHTMLGSQPAIAEEPALDGRMVRFPVSGSVTVVDFWATSCQPCLTVIPKLQDLYDTHHAAGLTIVGVASDDNPGLVDQTTKRMNVSYPNVLDPAGTLRGQYLVDELPQTFIFDRGGRLRVVFKGGRPTDVEELQRTVVTLLSSSGGQ